MIRRDEKGFNCSESALLRIDSEHSLPGFDKDIMRVASGFGGGVGGWGSICGAVSGGVMAFGLLYGTDGTEDLEEYDHKRSALRELQQDFFRAFETDYGSINCMDLLGVDRRTEEGNKRYQELHAQGAFDCGKYVDWAVEKVLAMLKEIE
jgi:C_GCAxxG_C_C family probable redox protein